MTDSNNDNNNDNLETQGFQGPDKFPTMEEIGGEERAQEEQSQQAKPNNTEQKRKSARKADIGRRRFLIAGLILASSAVVSHEVDKQRTSEIREDVDRLIEQIDLSEFMVIQDLEESEAVKKLAETLEDKGYEEGSDSNNLLSPKLTKAIGNKLMNEDFENLPEECGRYKYDKYEMGIDELYKLRGPAAKAFIRADKKMVADGKGHIKISRAFSVNMHQNDLFIAKQKNPKLPPAAPPGHSLHEAGLAVDIVNHRIAKEYLMAEGFYWLGNWRLSEKHHFQWGVSVKESRIMEGLYRVGKYVNVKEGKKWLKKGNSKLKKGADWLKREWNK